MAPSNQGPDGPTMRVCGFCPKSIEGRRPQTVYCGGPCRAAASRARAILSVARASPSVIPAALDETAQTGGNAPTVVDEYRLATIAEEAVVQRVMRRHADLAG